MGIRLKMKIPISDSSSNRIPPLDPPPFAEVQSNQSRSDICPYLYFIGQGVQGKTAVFYVKVGDQYFIMHKRCMSTRRDTTGYFNGKLSCSKKSSGCRFTMNVKCRVKDKDDIRFFEIDNWSVLPNQDVAAHAMISPPDVVLSPVMRCSRDNPVYCNKHHALAYVKSFKKQLPKVSKNSRALL